MTGATGRAAETTPEHSPAPRRDHAEARESHGEARAEWEALVRRRLAERIGREVAYGVAADEGLQEVGVDSLDVLFVVSQLDRDAESGRVATGDLWEIGHSVESLVDYISALRRRPAPPAAGGGDP